MSFKKDLTEEIQRFIDSPENIIDLTIKENVERVEDLSEKQMADICAVRRNNRSSADKFKYTREELELIIATVDSDPKSSFAKLGDALRQIDFILGKR